ncbi:MAG: methylated-DNA--[protein]-cysteine S-methyltransferase [Planctomycetota bacterium]
MAIATRRDHEHDAEALSQALSSDDAAHWSAGTFATPLGPMLAIAGDAGLTLLEFADRRALPRELQDVQAGGAIARRPHAVIEQTEHELGEYFEGRRTRFTIPLDPRGTPFERSVWDRLLTIPHGATASYADIARTLGKPGASRAIGRANGANRIAVVIPCHRVIRSDGALCGYGGGLERKRWLLQHEGAGFEGQPSLFASGGDQSNAG